jgi:hypothetical protein
VVAVIDMTCGRSNPSDTGEACSVCGARAGAKEDCPLLDASTLELLDRQRSVTAGRAAVCNPDDGVCESCQ